MTENEALSGAGSAPAMAPVEPTPESVVAVDDAAIQVELQQIELERSDLEARIVVLDERTKDLRKQLKQWDKRKDFNPIRNLKISANRAYGWAIKLPLEERKQKAIDAIFRSARETKEFKNHPDVEPWLNTGVLPEALMNYVETELPKTKKRRPKKVQQAS
jgi:hypothetical protein